MSIRFLPLTLVLAVCPVVQAGSIDWGTAVFDELYDADGQALDGSYRFEMGTFHNGFAPDATNLSLWQANWKLIEEAAFNAPVQYAAENSILSNDGPDLIWERDAVGDETTPNNPNRFSPGERVYVWAFNGKGITSTTQWALVTGNAAGLDRDWELNSALGAPLAETREWRLSNADTAVFGGINGDRGDGTFNATPVSFTLQTALIEPIPEPGTGTTLLALAAAFSLHRRRSHSPPHP